MSKNTLSPNLLMHRVQLNDLFSNRHLKMTVLCYGPL